MRRAWRREINDDDLQRMLPFVRGADTFESGIESALAAILVSREFLFRTEAPGDDALASKLAFFLWSSLPDNEMLSQRPLDPGAQARRMLRDPRAEALPYYDDNDCNPTAARSARGGPGDQFRRPMALPAQSRLDHARREALSRFRSQPA